jgi:molybdate transport system substrate-binding protein
VQWDNDSMKRLVLGFVLLTSLAFAQPKQEVTVAAAANLTEVFKELGPKFEAASGIHPVFSFASTAQLTGQVANGAPFDVFAAADTEHVDQLDQKKLLTPGSRAIYARGVLAVWTPPGTKAPPIRRLQDLTNTALRVIAIAKPELAPYGEAAVAALKKAGIWDQVQSKVVYAENINMAKQYGTSGNADAVLTAYSLVLHEQGTVIQVDPALHPPLDQALGIVAASTHQEAAKKFDDFLLHGAGRAVLRDFGYQVSDIK